MKPSKLIIESLRRDWEKKLAEHVKIYEELTVASKVNSKEEKNLISVGLKLLDKDKNSYVVVEQSKDGNSVKVKRDSDGEELVIKTETLEKDFERR